MKTRYKFFGGVSLVVVILGSYWLVSGSRRMLIDAPLVDALGSDTHVLNTETLPDQVQIISASELQMYAGGFEAVTADRITFMDYGGSPCITIIVTKGGKKFRQCFVFPDFKRSPGSKGEFVFDQPKGSTL